MAEVTYLWRVVQHWLDRQPFPPNQSALARAIGVQRSAVSDWKTGKSRPNPENMRKLATLMEPSYGPMAYTALVMAMTADMGFGEWVIGAEERLPEGARIDYVGDATYGVFRGLVNEDDYPEDEEDEDDDFQGEDVEVVLTAKPLSARDRRELEEFRRREAQAAVRRQHGPAAEANPDEPPGEAREAD